MLVYNSGGRKTKILKTTPRPKFRSNELIFDRSAKTSLFVTWSLRSSEIAKRFRNF